MVEGLSGHALQFLRDGKTYLPTRMQMQKQASPSTRRQLTAAAQLRHAPSGTEHDIRVIQVLLGHAKLETTALYTQVATRAIREVMSPLDQMIRQFPTAEPPA